MRKMLSLTALIGGLIAASTAQADITVGFVTSLSGPGSSIGIPYGRGIQAAMEYKSEVNGEKIRLIQLDDGSDPSAATRNARKLIEEEKVDLLIGTATTPSTIAMMGVATELKVPMIAVSPLNGQPNPADQWAISVPQPASLLVKIVADRMKRDAMKNIGYIGFSDAWGDLVYNGAKAAEADDGIKVLTNERYARVDTSVTGQILKVLAVRPDAVLIGGSGTQGALPLLALGERGYKGKTYGRSPWSIRISFASAARPRMESRSPPARSSWPSSFPTVISPRSSRLSSAPPSRRPTTSPPPTASRPIPSTAGGSSPPPRSAR